MSDKKNLSSKPDEAAHEKNDQADYSHLKADKKVAAKKKPLKALYYLGGFVVVALVGVMMLSGSRSERMAQKAVDIRAHKNEFTDSAQQRLDQFYAQQKKEQQPIASPFGLPRQQKPAIDQALLQRQNAPTSLFDAGRIPPLQKGVVTGMNAPGKTTTSGLSGSSAYANFANGQATLSASVQATQLSHPGYTIATGDFIHAVLETAINSDLPGMVRATVSQPVYSYVGERVLIPRGSRLIGQYASIAGNGSATARVFVIWNRIITPNGVSILINSPSTGELGDAGQGADDVDHHFWRIFGTGALLSVIGATVALDTTSYAQPNSASQYRSAVSDSFNQTARKTLSKNTNIKPTLHVYQGSQINVFTAHDLDLYAVLHTRGAP